MTKQLDDVQLCFGFLYAISCQPNRKDFYSFDSLQCHPNYNLSAFTNFAQNDYYPGQKVRQ